MPTNNTAVSVRGISKAYTIAHERERHSTLGEAIVQRFKRPFQRAERETFWALKDVSFEIQKGDVVGIIGRNGAGKSTLLKVLSQITTPTTGQIDLYGRVGSLLEVGTGFHPELTGRENIYLNGAILGMRRAEINRQFDAIVDFAGVDQFLDTPVKRYSSGMYVRLAFAVAAHLNSEILVIDEVLSVGDLEFQRKCLGKIRDVATGGRTVLFVSHQMQAVSTLCRSAIYMESGTPRHIGDVGRAIDLYMSRRGATAPSDAIERRGGSGEVRVSRLRSDKDTYLSIEDIRIEATINTLRSGQPAYFISMEFVNQFGIPVFHLDSRLLNVEFDEQEERTVMYTIRNSRLAQGDYSVNIFICSVAGVIDRFERATEFCIAPVLPYPGSRNDICGNALVYPDFSIEVIGQTAPDPIREVVTFL